MPFAPTKRTCGLHPGDLTTLTYTSNNPNGQAGRRYNACPAGCFLSWADTLGENDGNPNCYCGRSSRERQHELGERRFDCAHPVWDCGWSETRPEKWSVLEGYREKARQEEYEEYMADLKYGADEEFWDFEQAGGGWQDDKKDDKKEKKQVEEEEEEDWREKRRKAWMETDVEGDNELNMVEILSFREEGEECDLCMAFGGGCGHSG